jgi:hypothetical protein
MRTFSLYTVLFFVMSTQSFAKESTCQLGSLVPVSDSLALVFSKSGNIYYRDNRGHTIQITQTGKDSSPELSPNKHMIAFVRTGNQVIPDRCDVDATYGNEIWLYNFSTKKENRLVKNNFECDEPTKRIVDPDHLLFSLDSRTLYFETSAWTTSGAIHAVNINGKYTRFVTDGGNLRVVQSGPYKGDLIINQHRYRFEGDTPLGSYDWDWLFTPTGKQIKLYKKV